MQFTALGASSLLVSCLVCRSGPPQLSIASITVNEAEAGFVGDENLEPGETLVKAYKAFDGEGSFLCAGALLERRRSDCDDSKPAFSYDCWIADSIERGVGPNLQLRGAQFVLDELFHTFLQTRGGMDDVALSDFNVLAGTGEGTTAAARAAAISRGFTHEAICEDTAESVLRFDAANGLSAYASAAADAPSADAVLRLLRHTCESTRAADEAPINLAKRSAGASMTASSAPSPQPQALRRRVVTLDPSLRVTLFELSDAPNDTRDAYGSRLWPAAAFLSRYLAASPQIVQGRSVLELGCGNGLVSLVTAALGAAAVLATDYRQLPLDLVMEAARATASGSESGGGGGESGGGGGESGGGGASDGSQSQGSRSAQGDCRGATARPTVLSTRVIDFADPMPPAAIIHTRSRAKRIAPCAEPLPSHEILLAADVGYSPALAWRLGERCRQTLTAGGRVIVAESRQNPACRKAFSEALNLGGGWQRADAQPSGVAAEANAAAPLRLTAREAVAESLRIMQQRQDEEEEEACGGGGDADGRAPDAPRPDDEAVAVGGDSETAAMWFLDSGPMTLRSCALEPVPAPEKP